MFTGRKVFFYKNYFREFYERPSHEVQRKIDYVLKIVETVDRVPEKFFKHMEGAEGLFEVRVKALGSIYRIFCVFEEDQVVVLFNGFQKKTEKTPKAELLRALRIKREYEEE